MIQRLKKVKKEIHWFENGTHSKVRLADHDKYDEIVKNFITKN